MAELRISRYGNDTTGLKGREYYLLDRSPERRILDFRGQEGFHSVRLLGRYRYATAKSALAAHSHGPMLEICYLASGRQTYDVKGQEFSLVGGDVFMAFPGEPHGTGYHPVTRGVLYWLLISVAEARRSFLNLPRPEGRQLLRRLLQVPCHSFRGRNTLLPTLRAIFEVHADIRNPLRAVNLRNLLLRFLLDVVNSAYKSQPATHSAKIQAMMDHVEANLEWPLVLSELARHVGMSLPRLKSKFKQEVGIPPADYIMRRRVERAAQLLYETKDTVLDIAMRLGFSSSQYFATVFKRYTLHSPHEARTQRLKL
jgi:AraC-like DNA-binding protein